MSPSGFRRPDNGRCARRGAHRDRTAIRETVIPMAAGSVLGAILGGLLLGIAPAAGLKFGLGIILIASAVERIVTCRKLARHLREFR